MALGIQGPQLDPASAHPKAGRTRWKSGPITAHPQSYKEGSLRVKERAGLVTIQEATEWYNAQIPYENLAQTDSIAERVVGFVRERKRVYQDQTMVLRRRWRIINHLLHGNSVASLWGLEDVHVPELYKMLETITPRIEEAILDFDPFFNVKGRDDEDRMVDNLIGAFLEFQFDEAKVSRMIQPTIRCMLTYQFAAWKIDWERQFKWGVIKEVEEVHVPKQEEPEYIFRRRRAHMLHYDGPRYRLVDPFDFIIDLGAINADDALYIGDTRDVTLEELRQLQELGIYKRVDEVSETEPSQESYNTVAYDKWARSVATRFDAHRRDPSGSPQVHRETELHCKFDLYDDGDEIDCILNVINDQTCVRAIENFYDKKFRPYALARTAKEGFDFFNVGPLDHAVRINEEIDQHRALWMEAAKLSVCPMVFTERETDLPESMFGVAPGSVFQGVGSVTFSQMPSTLRDVPLVQETLRRDIEEITGAPRIFEATSSSEGQTATEVMRKIEEGNRRIRSYVRSLSELLEDALQITHLLNGQFLTRRQPFRVLGKRGKAVGEYSSVSPIHFQRTVDFEFEGVSSLHTMGLRATALVKFMEISKEIRDKHPGAINELALLHDLYENTVGLRPGEEIVRIPTPVDELLSPEQENLMLFSGQAVQVDPMDSSEIHLPSHAAFLQKNQSKMTEKAVRVTSEHILNHLWRDHQKTIQASAQGQAPHAFPPGVQPNQPGLATGEGDMGAPTTETPLGESAGPDNLFKMETPGRDHAFSQTDNQAVAQ